MDENTQTVKTIPSSVMPDGYAEPIKAEYEMIGTWYLVGFLFIVFFVLKSFIYIPDEKRKGK
jgi:hypothetical protein